MTRDFKMQGVSIEEEHYLLTDCQCCHYLLMDSISLDTVNMNSMHFLLMLNIPYSKTLIKSKPKLDMKSVSIFLQKKRRFFTAAEENLNNY